MTSPLELLLLIAELPWFLGWKQHSIVINPTRHRMRHDQAMT